MSHSTPTSDEYEPNQKKRKLSPEEDEQNNGLHDHHMMNFNQSSTIPTNSIYMQPNMMYNQSSVGNSNSLGQANNDHYQQLLLNQYQQQKTQPQQLQNGPIFDLQYLNGSNGGNNQGTNQILQNFQNVYNLTPEQQQKLLSDYQVQKQSNQEDINQQSSERNTSREAIIERKVTEYVSKKCIALGISTEEEVDSIFQSEKDFSEFQQKVRSTIQNETEIFSHEHHYLTVRILSLITCCKTLSNDITDFDKVYMSEKKKLNEKLSKEEIQQDDIKEENYKTTQHDIVKYLEKRLDGMRDLMLLLTVRIEVLYRILYEKEYATSLDLNNSAYWSTISTKLNSYINQNGVIARDTQSCSQYPKPSQYSNSLARFTNEYDNVRERDQLYKKSNCPMALNVFQAKCNLNRSLLNRGYIFLPSDADMKGDVLAVSGSRGLRQSNPQLQIQYASENQIKTLSESMISPQQTQIPYTSKFDSGFYSKAESVYVDIENDLVWQSGDYRIKAFSTTKINSQDISERNKYHSQEEYTLYAGDEVLSLLKLREKLFASTGNGIVKYWDCDTLDEQPGKTMYRDDLDFDDEEGLLNLKEHYSEIRNDFSTCEVSRGVERTGEINMLMKNDDLNHLEVFHPQGQSYSIKNMTFYEESKILYNINNCFHFRMYDLESQKTVMLFNGGGGKYEDIKYSKEKCPYLIATANSDTFAKVWDSRTASIVFSLNGHLKPLLSIDISTVNGIPYVFTGGSDESIRIWDLRMQTCLYELSTGNNNVKKLFYHSNSNSLFAITECTDISRFDQYVPENEKQNLNTIQDMTSYDILSQSNMNIEREEKDWCEGSLHLQQDFDEDFQCISHSLLHYQYKDVVNPLPKRRETNAAALRQQQQQQHQMLLQKILQMSHQQQLQMQHNPGNYDLSGNDGGYPGMYSQPETVSSLIASQHSHPQPFIQPPPAPSSSIPSSSQQPPSSANSNEMRVRSLLIEHSLMANSEVLHVTHMKAFLRKLKKGDKSIRITGTREELIERIIKRFVESKGIKFCTRQILKFFHVVNIEM